MDKELKSSGYVYNKKYSIWERPSAPPFLYSDGELVEQSLYEGIKSISDRSVFSEEVFVLQKDWPSTYHFSFQRSNLLRPLEKSFVGARVLELGCGCGALSRYIGETAKELCAVDGSPSRASIAALRCEDLENTTFIVDRVQDVPETIGKFDIVLLVGVLEYANMFSSDIEPSYSLLCKAKSFLKEDGFLVLAIENKLGLKYFAGIPEDHTSVSWCSIVDGYHPKGPYTFSRHELSSLLTNAGFSYQEQFVVSPDYKLPASVITPLGLKVKIDEFDPVPILAYPQHVYKSTSLFNLPQAWRGVYQAGLLLDLTDSLCFIASLKEKRFFAENILCYHYGVLDRVTYSKEVRFVREEEGIYVRRCSLGKDRERNNVLDREEYFQHIEDEEYFSGKLLIEQMREVCVRDNWSIHELKDVILPWFLWLKEYMDGGEISANFIDATPFNVFVQKDGSIVLFDQEWKSNKKLPFIYVVTRALVNSFIRMGVVAKCLEIKSHIKFLFLVENLLQLLGMSCSQEDIFQACSHPNIIEKTFDKDFEFYRFLEGELKITPQHHFLWFDNDIICKQSIMLEEEIARANKLEADYTNLESSFSMRVTAPFRYIRKQLATLKQFLA